MKKISISIALLFVLCSNMFSQLPFPAQDVKLKVQPVPLSNTLRGEWSGHFRDTRIFVFIDSIVHNQVFARNMLKGFERNIDGYLHEGKYYSEIVLFEPGDDKNDGSFFLYIDKEKDILCGKWEGRKSKGKIEFELSREYTQEAQNQFCGNWIDNKGCKLVLKQNRKAEIISAPKKKGSNTNIALWYTDQGKIIIEQWGNEPPIILQADDFAQPLLLKNEDNSNNIFKRLEFTPIKTK